MRLLAAAFLLIAAGTAQAQFQESISVVRIVFDLRVTDSRGNPIRDLTPADFDIRIAGKRAEVESLEWIDDVGASSRRVDESTSTEPLDDSATRRLDAPPGRLLVFFVQTDFARNAIRIGGHLNFLRYAEKMIEDFAPQDRVAVMQFDSHLKLRLDFSSEKERVLAALRDTILINVPNRPPLVPEPSLASRLDFEDARQATDSETGLLVLGNALRSIPGPKTILLMGWGLGRLSNGVVQMTAKYTLARQALDRARATIFAIDVPEADYHSLEVGLQQAAEDTGGLYVKTFRFPQLAVDRMQRTLEGHYEMTLRRPEGLVPGTHDLRVRVKRRGAVVLAPSTYMDRH